MTGAAGRRSKGQARAAKELSVRAGRDKTNHNLFLTHIVRSLELQTFKILAAERLRLIKMGTRLIADYFQHAVNILKW